MCYSEDRFTHFIVTFLYNTGPGPQHQELCIPRDSDIHITLGFTHTIICMPVRSYAEMIEQRLKSSALLSDHKIAAEKLLRKAVADAKRRGLLFVVILNEQNELHHSLTLNILHGTPQGMVPAMAHINSAEATVTRHICLSIVISNVFLDCCLEIILF